MARAHAQAELRLHAGRQFDPRVVDALLAVLDRQDAPTLETAGG
jgi:response regulator RpfG family c-di-GMP phosphodiesterase